MVVGPLMEFYQTEIRISLNGCNLDHCQIKSPFHGKEIRQTASAWPRTTTKELLCRRLIGDSLEPLLSSFTEQLPKLLAYEANVQGTGNAVV